MRRVTLALLSLLLVSATTLAQPANLLAYYPFTGDATDWSGNGHDGTVYCAELVGDRHGNTECAYWFQNGTRIECGDPPDNSFDLVEDATLSCWMQLASNPPGTGSGICFSLIGKDIWNGTVSKWFFGVQYNHLCFHTNGPGLGSGLWIVSDSYPFSLNTWYHTALTKSGTTYTFYIDGVETGIRTLAHVIPDVAAGLSIGRAEPSCPHHGKIDEVRFYNRAFDDSEMLTLFQGPGIPLQLTIAATEDAVTLDWLEVEDADSYRVYSATPYSNFTIDGTGVFDGDSWLAPMPAGPRFYQVTAVR